jgi:translation initiation factor 3 subunit F
MMADDILKTTMVDKLPNDLEGMEASMERLLALIDDVYKYVDNVVVK